MGLYLASKAALNQLLSCAAQEVKDKNIKINAVLPTIIDNPQNRKDMPDADTSKWVKPAELSDIVYQMVGDLTARVNGALIPVS